MGKKLVIQDTLVAGIIDSEVFIIAATNEILEGIEKQARYEVTRDIIEEFLELGIRAGIAFGQKGGKDGNDKGRKAGSDTKSSS